MIIGKEEYPYYKIHDKIRDSIYIVIKRGKAI